MLRIQIFDDWAGWRTVERTPDDVDYAARVARAHLDVYKVEKARVMDGTRRLVQVTK